MAAAAPLASRPLWPVVIAWAIGHFTWSVVLAALLWQRGDKVGR
jgi:hypothetical protein